MAETILLGFAKIVLGQLGSVAVDEVKLALGLEDELDKIKSNLSSIQAVLRDAEKQQSTSESVKNWLGNLQDVMYDIDDLLDDITTEVSMRDINKGQWRKKVRKFFSRTNTLVLRSQWAHQMKKLCSKLDQIAYEKNSFMFFTEPVGSLILSSRETHASVDKSELILGRDQDKEAIMSLVLNSSDQERLSVVPIVGIGGMGKTTLAQLIYNDSRIDDNFDKKLWVYVSEKFNMKKILTLVLSMATGENILQLTTEQLSLEQLRIKISEAFKYKKYFLILDDMWNEDSNEWRKLRELLDVGAKGSTTIVTTRDTKVASIVKSSNEYKLSELSQETSLQIFKQLAFRDGERIESTLLNLSEKIVEKSRGIPLLVTTLGKLLHGNKDEREWQFVIQKLEKGHEDILNILKLSYDQLHSYTKLCFRISSIYGKGFDVVPILHLLPLWTALGFLPYDSQGEALGRKCVEELSSKSLFTKQDDDAPDDMFNSFRMHDFVYDLAKFVAGDELAVVNCSSTKEVPDQIRYMRLDEDEMLGKLCDQGLLNHAKKARLLLINNSEQSLSKDLLESIISSFKCLRVLDLNGCQFEELPRTIGYMKHLRYLNLARNSKIKQLPESVCNLINLQSLILTYCNNLQKLPADIGRLENLRYLMVTTQQEFLPESIGLLKALRMLFLCNCPKLVCLPSSTKQLESLDTLFMFGCEELDLGHGSWSLEGLNSLRVLGILDLPKFQKLPVGVKCLPFTSLEHLFVVKCDGLTEITDWIEYLTSLKTLKIGNCYNLKGLSYTRLLLEKLENLQQIEIN